jgi:hypothetical protein
LKSPEKYPFENRIAMGKTYMRNLDTIDIEGASSSTRVSQSIKNKVRAREELVKRGVQAETLESQEKNYEEKRRGLAMKQQQEIEDKKNRRV